MFCIFFFHNARFFDVFSDWHVRNSSTSIGASVLVAFLSQWIMPLFFVVAGAGTFYALKFRKPGQFIGERTLRLLIPFIFGLLVIVVPQAYFESLSHGKISEINFFQFYPQYLTSFLPELHWYHLWFLAYLFIFSILTLPLFIDLCKIKHSVISGLASIVKKSWVLILLLVVPIFLTDAFLDPSTVLGNRDSGGWNIISYLIFYIFGYLIFSSTKILETIKKSARTALAIGIVTSTIIIWFSLNESISPGTHSSTLFYVIAYLTRGINSWSWIVAIIGLSSQFLNRNNKFLVYASEAVLPFYILHQTVIISVGYYVVQWNIGIAPKYLIISSISFLLIMALYELLVRRFNILRFLFGMKLRKRASIS